MIHKGGRPTLRPGERSDDLNVSLPISVYTYFLHVARLHDVSLSSVVRRILLKEYFQKNKVRRFRIRPSKARSSPVCDAIADDGRTRADAE